MTSFPARAKYAIREEKGGKIGHARSEADRIGEGASVRHGLENDRSAKAIRSNLSENNAHQGGLEVAIGTSFLREQPICPTRKVQSPPRQLASPLDSETR